MSWKKFIIFLKYDMKDFVCERYKYQIDNKIDEPDAVRR